MSEEAFEAAIFEARKLEKKIMEYTPYEGEVEIEKSLETEPVEYVDLNYHDLFNLYERTQKIISTTGMGILAKREEEKVEVSVESREVETKLKEMTTETLKEAAEIAKEPSIEEKVAPPTVPHIELEAEKPQEIEFEAKETPSGELELEREVEIPFKETPKEEKAEIEIEEREPVPPSPVPPSAIPPTLRETPSEAAAKRYQRIEEQVRSMLGEGADELTIKKKMLELTKQLFKEKTTSKREEIKTQIKALKNMLTSAREGGKKKKEVTQTQFEAMYSAQQEELAHTKGKLIDSYHKQTIVIKDKFYTDMLMIEAAEEKKKTYETFVSSVTMLIENLPAAVKKEHEFVSKKHTAEMEKLLSTLADKDKILRKKVEERLAYIEASYSEEFSTVKQIVGREIENIIDVAGTEIFQKPEEEKRRKADPTEIVKEINETDNGTLLYFLHSKEPEYYKKFERKQISKAEAIFKAKELLAKEKGLNESMITKYFSLKED